MSLFPIIETDGKVQIGEKHRISGDKSFVTKGSTDITTLTVKPEDDISAISIFDATTKNRYLDWIFNDFEIDIDSTNNKLNFKESGGSELTATLSSGTYTLSTLATEIKTQMDAAGSGTYTVSYDVNDKITISSTVSFELLKSTGTNKATSILSIIGFLPKNNAEDTGFDTSHIGKRTRWLTRKVTLEAGDGVDTANAYQYIKVYSEDGDALFSSDSDLISHESDILKYVPNGKSGFNYVHREAQELILSWLDENGYVDVYGDKFTIENLLDIDEVRQWSKFMVLKILFRGMSNAIDDIFMKKSSDYEKKELEHRNRAILRIDIDDDGQIDVFEDVRIRSGRVFRR